MTARVVGREIDGEPVDPSGPFCSIVVARTDRRPASLRFRVLLRYRWGVERFELAEGAIPGLFDRYMHVGGEGGRPLTEAGARWAAARRSKCRSAVI